jgi:hypothetical protein
MGECICGPQLGFFRSGPRFGGFFLAAIDMELIVSRHSNSESTRIPGSGHPLHTNLCFCPRETASRSASCGVAEPSFTHPRAHKIFSPGFKHKHDAPLTAARMHARMHVLLCGACMHASHNKGIIFARNNAVLPVDRRTHACMHACMQPTNLCTQHPNHSRDHQCGITSARAWCPSVPCFLRACCRRSHALAELQHCAAL